MSRKNARARQQAPEPESWFEGESWFEEPQAAPEPVTPAIVPQPALRQCAAPGCDRMFTPEEDAAMYCRRACKNRARVQRRRDEAASAGPVR